MDPSILKTVADYFFEENFDCTLIAENEEETLLLFLGNDPNERERILKLTHQEQQIKNKDEGNFHRFQFFTLLPFEIKPHTIHDLNSTVAFFNASLDLPGFECHEIDNKVAFRYVLLSDRFPDKKLFLSLVGLILLNVDLLSETFEKVASGKTTFYDLLKVASDTLKNL